MRDEMDARIWVEHHEAFAETVDRGLEKARAAFARFAAWDGTTHQLLALLVSFCVTAITFRTTVI